MIKVSSSTKTSILLIFLSEIFLAISAISVFGRALGILMIFGIAGFVLMLIGVISLRKVSEPFKKVFIGTISAIVLVVISVILAAVWLGFANEENNTGVLVITIIAAIFRALSILTTIYITINLIRGCCLLINGREDGEFGKKTLTLYVAAAITNAAIIIIASCPFPEPLVITLSVCALVFMLVAYVFIIILIGSTYSKLEATNSK